MVRSVLLLAALPVLAAAQALPPFQTDHNGSLANPDGAAGAYQNAAGAAFDPESGELEYFGSLEDADNSYHSDWSVYSKMGSLGFGVRHVGLPGDRFTNQFRLGLGMGDRDNHVGVAYAWNKGNRPGGDGPDEFLLSSLDRFAPFGLDMPQFSLGMVHHFLLGNDPLNRSFHANRYWGEGGLSVRPAPSFKGTETLSLFCDAAWDRNAEFHGDRVWYGAQWSPFNMVNLTFRKNANRDDIAMGLDVQLGNLGLGYLGAEMENLAGGDNPTANRAHVRMNSSLFHKVRLMNPPRQTYAHLKLEGMAGDYTWLISGAKFKLPEFLDQMEAIGKDPHVKGLLVEMKPGFQADPNVLWEIHRSLKDFRAKGREIVFYSHSMGLGSLYLASQADRVALLPIGEAEIGSLGSEQLYFKDALARAGMEFTRWNIGAYKGAGENFSNAAMSPEVRENVGRALRELYEHMTTEIQSGFGLDAAAMEQLTGSYFHNAKDLMAMGLVDTLIYDDNVEDWVCHRDPDKDDNKDGKDGKGGLNIEFSFGMPGGGSKENLKPMSAFMTPMSRTQWMDDRQIAVIYASGPIRDGSSIGPFVIGHETVIEQLARARKNDRIKAVVLYVDSPGGSGYASDLVWHEMQRLQEDKPLVVVQGFLAASGGYYFSMSGDKVITSPLTITGSIGVAAGAFFDKGVMDASGFTQDGVWAGKAPLGGAVMPFGVNLDAANGSLRLPAFPVAGRPLNEQQDREIRSLIRTFYDDFVDKVAQGRKMEWDQVHAIAEGRVWSGPTAIELKLADSIGGLREGIAEAARQAELEGPVEVEEYYPGFNLGQLFELLGAMNGDMSLETAKAQVVSDATQTARDEQILQLGSGRPELLFDLFMMEELNLLP
jgi:protease-4